MRGTLSRLTEFALPTIPGQDLDVLAEARRLLDLAIRQYEPREAEADTAQPAAQPAEGGVELELTALLMAGKYAEVQQMARKLGPQDRSGRRNRRLGVGTGRRRFAGASEAG